MLIARTITAIFHHSIISHSFFISSRRGREEGNYSPLCLLMIFLSHLMSLTIHSIASSITRTFPMNSNILFFPPFLILLYLIFNYLSIHLIKIFHFFVLLSANKTFISSNSSKVAKSRINLLQVLFN